MQNLPDNKDALCKKQYSLKPKKAPKNSKSSGHPSKPDSQNAQIFQDAFTYCEERHLLLTQCNANIQFFWNPQNGSLPRNFIYSTVNHLLFQAATTGGEFHDVLLRRFSCVTIFIISVIGGLYYNERELAGLFHRTGLHLDTDENTLEKRIASIRYGGKRYMDVSMRLGGVGALWFLPLEAKPSVYVFTIVLIWLVITFLLKLGTISPKTRCCVR